jgi:hypothetical protein
LGIEVHEVQFYFSSLNDRRRLENYFLPIKPTFPDGGQLMNCPHCGHSVIYQTSDLRFQP